MKGAWKEKRWNLHTDFEITDDAADQLNEKDIDLKISQKHLTGDG
ncbi:hypothetical protein ACIL82_12950 [Enterococcus faecium]